MIKAWIDIGVYTLLLVAFVYFFMADPTVFACVLAFSTLRLNLAELQTKLDQTDRVRDHQIRTLQQNTVLPPSDFAPSTERDTVKRD